MECISLFRSPLFMFYYFSWKYKPAILWQSRLSFWKWTWRFITCHIRSLFLPLHFEYGNNPLDFAWTRIFCSLSCFSLSAIHSFILSTWHNDGCYRHSLHEFHATFLSSWIPHQPGNALSLWKALSSIKYPFSLKVFWSIQKRLQSSQVKLL